jgi:transmembrane sensor
MSERELKEDVSEVFFERRYGEWTAEKQAQLNARLSVDAAFARVYRSAEETWRALGGHAQAPEIVAFREAALAEVRRTSVRRWTAAVRTSWWRVAAGLVALGVLGIMWQLSPYGYHPGVYQTRVGELRMLELEDHSLIAIDSATRLRVRYSHDARLVELLEGQAQFTVTPDPTRPFKVQVADRTIVAVGTVFTVEYVEREIHVAMIEGKVAILAHVRNDAFPIVLSPPRLPTDSPVEQRTDGNQRQHASGAHLQPSVLTLTAGEALKVHRDGQAIIVQDADLEAATAWREGKIILRADTLEEAVRKMNRYSTVKLELHDPSLANERISGVFEVGNSQRFVADLERLLAIDARYIDSRTVELRRR